MGSLLGLALTVVDTTASLYCETQRLLAQESLLISTEPVYDTDTGSLR
jgi:hypothetical protein